MPADDITDPAPATASRMDAITVLAPAHRAWNLPGGRSAVSVADLDPNILGAEHDGTTRDVQRSFFSAKDLQDIIAILGRRLWTRTSSPSPEPEDQRSCPSRSPSQSSSPASPGDTSLPTPSRASAKSSTASTMSYLSRRSTWSATSARLWRGQEARGERLTVADRITLEIATPTRLAGRDGRRDRHPRQPGLRRAAGPAAFLTTLGVEPSTGSARRASFAVAGGFAEVRNDKVIVLADTAERPEEIDRTRAERARERAERRLAGRVEEEVDYQRALAALARALARLLTAGRSR